MEKLYTAMLPWAEDAVQPRRRYLTDPEEIKAYRKRHWELLRREMRLAIKRLPTTLLKLYHKAVVEFTITMVALSLWLAALGIGGWAITSITHSLGWD